MVTSIWITTHVLLHLLWDSLSLIDLHHSVFLSFIDLNFPMLNQLTIYNFLPMDYIQFYTNWSDSVYYQMTRYNALPIDPIHFSTSWPDPMLYQLTRFNALPADLIKCSASRSYQMLYQFTESNLLPSPHILRFPIWLTINLQL